MHWAASSQWPRAMEQLAAAEKLAEGKPGIRFLRYAVLKSARRNEEVKNLFQQEAAALRDSPLATNLRPAPGEGSAVRAGEFYLANYLLGQSGGVLETNEMLGLLDTLEPVFARQPEHLKAMKQWNEQRAAYLSNCGRGNEALEIRKVLAEAYPRDISAQTTYIQELQNRQEFEAVRKWVERVLAGDVPWEQGEIDQLRGLYAGSLRSQERYDELAEYLARWLAENPESADPYSQYLEALLDTEHVDMVESLMTKWFAEGRRADITPAAAARLQTAVDWTSRLSENYHGDGNYHFEDRWQKELIETALFFALHKTQYSIADRIIGSWQFNQTEGIRKLREKLAAMFAEHFDRLSPHEISRFVGWLRNYRDIVTNETWCD